MKLFVDFMIRLTIFLRKHSPSWVLSGFAENCLQNPLNTTREISIWRWCESLFLLRTCIGDDGFFCLFNGLCKHLVSGSNRLMFIREKVTFREEIMMLSKMSVRNMESPTWKPKNVRMGCTIHNMYEHVICVLCYLFCFKSMLRIDFAYQLKKAKCWNY